MRRSILTLILSIFFTGTFLPFNGEFMIYKTTNSNENLTLQLKSIGNAWLWDSFNNNTYLSPIYNKTFTDVSFGFDAPKDVNVGKNGAMAWGLMEFTLSSSSASITFTIDFRDERWATGYYSPDIVLYFDTQTGAAYLDPQPVGM